MLAYTEFDRPYAAPPGISPERLHVLPDSFEKMLPDPAYITEAKKLVDWDGVSFLNGPDLQKKIEKTITQPQEVIKTNQRNLKRIGSVTKTKSRSTALANRGGQQQRTHNGQISA